MFLYTGFSTYFSTIFTSLGFSTYFSTIFTSDFCSGKYSDTPITDNGVEFSKPDVIEYNGNHVYKTKLFYCDPGASNQKGKLENTYNGYNIVYNDYIVGINKGYK